MLKGVFSQTLYIYAMRLYTPAQVNVIKMSILSRLLKIAFKNLWILIEDWKEICVTITCTSDIKFDSIDAIMSVFVLLMLYLTVQFIYIYIYIWIKKYNSSHVQ